MKTKEFITKYYWIILLFLSFGAGLLLMWFFRPSDTKDDFNRIKAEKEVLVKKHLADSVFFVRKADSLATIIETLKVVSYTKGAEIVRLRALNQAKTQEVAKLPASEAILYFSDNTGMKSTLLADSTVSTPLPAISVANSLFSERIGYTMEILALESRMSVQDTIIDKQGVLLGVKDQRIKGLTSDYYASMKISADQEALNKKLRKKIRTKNAVMGTLIGVATAAIVVTVVK
jgi:hypothetical protein